MFIPRAFVAQPYILSPSREKPVNEQNSQSIRQTMLNRLIARNTVEELSGALPRTVRALEPYIKPLSLEAELYQENDRKLRW